MSKKRICVEGFVKDEVLAWNDEWSIIKVMENESDDDEDDRLASVKGEKRRLYCTYSTCYQGRQSP